jgi:hypothetical protein
LKPDENCPDSLECLITVYGNQPDQGDLNAKLQEFHAKDKKGDPKYRKTRGYSTANGSSLPKLEIVSSRALYLKILT